MDITALSGGMPDRNDFEVYRNRREKRVDSAASLLKVFVFCVPAQSS